MYIVNLGNFRRSERSTANERNVIDYLRGHTISPIRHRGSFVLAANKPNPEPNIGKKGTVFLDWIGLRMARNDQLERNEASGGEQRRGLDDFATPSATSRTDLKLTRSVIDRGSLS